jgi:arginase
MDITIICVPFQVDVARWGCARGPQALLNAGIAELIRAKGHNICDVVWIDLPKSERTRDSITNLGRIAHRTAAAVKAALAEQNRFVLVLAGDCTHSLGPIGGLAQARGRPGVVWFDAHGDMNTWETTTTGLLGGMPYAVALGWDLSDWRLAAGLDPAVRPEAAALIGTSDLDPAETEALQRHPILHLDAQHLMQPRVAERVQAALSPRATEANGWYIHLDLDVAGPEELPGGMTPAPYWPPRSHLLEAVGATTRSVPVQVLTVAVYNPTYDHDGRGARLAIDMAMAVVDNL